jgi:membrane fusion protein (multidrug efflux system)
MTPSRSKAAILAADKIEPGESVTPPGVSKQCAAPEKRAAQGCAANTCGSMLESTVEAFAWDTAKRVRRLAELSKDLEVIIRTDAFPGREFRGTLTAINSVVDVATRNVSLQATLPNPDHVLRPGMFARIEVLLPQAEEKVLVIPATSVFSAPYGDSVYVIESKPGKDGKAQSVVRQQFIRTGRTRGDFVTVETGLKAGDRVASSGVFKLRNGVPVVENNELTPKATEAPKPADS